MDSTQWKKFHETGFIIIKNQFDKKWIPVLSTEMDKSFVKHRNIQLKNNNGINSEGVALHSLLDSDIFINFLKDLINSGFIQSIQDNFFKSKCILNSFSSLNNLPNQPNFSSNVHRDIRFYSGKFPMMLNCLIMIDDFTIENGATYLLPYSHLEESKPTDSEFYKKSIQATGKKGDILIFNSNVWHSSAHNKTFKDRRAIPITISKPFMKQLLDYPRALGYDKMLMYDDDLLQFLGYYSRVPASLDEWYQPDPERFYKKYQD